MKQTHTPHNADAACRLLDNGWRISLMKNSLGTYTATARNAAGGRIETDDATPSQALYRLAEKAIGHITPSA